MNNVHFKCTIHWNPSNTSAYIALASSRVFTSAAVRCPLKLLGSYINYLVSRFYGHNIKPAMLLRAYCVWDLYYSHFVPALNTCSKNVLVWGKKRLPQLTQWNSQLFKQQHTHTKSLSKRRFGMIMWIHRTSGGGLGRREGPHVDVTQQGQC